MRLKAPLACGLIVVSLSAAPLTYVVRDGSGNAWADPPTKPAPPPPPKCDPQYGCQRDKMQTAEKHAAAIRTLLKPKPETRDAAPAGTSAGASAGAASAPNPGKTGSSGSSAATPSQTSVAPPDGKRSEVKDSHDRAAPQ